MVSTLCGALTLNLACTRSDLTHPEPILRADVSLQSGVAFFPNSQVVIFARQNVGLCSVPAKERWAPYASVDCVPSWRPTFVPISKEAHS